MLGKLSNGGRIYERLAACNNRNLVGQMRRELFEHAKGTLCRAFSEVFNSEVVVTEVKEESLQEKLSIQVQVLDLVS